MAPPPAPPSADLAAVAEVEQRLFALVRAVDDAGMHQPSLLPGWSVGHLLTHLARNADSHTHRTAAAVDGVVIDQYPGGAAERESDIEAGARRPAVTILEDVATSSARMLEAWARAPDRAWSGVTRDLSGLERPLVELPGRRRMEVEVHLVDLGLGPTHRDWSDAFVADRLGPMRAGLATRLPDGSDAPPPGALDERDELAWLYGRLARPDLPELGPWS